MGSDDLLSLRATLLNTRSLHKHNLETFSLLQEERPDILALTETWLEDNSGPDIVASLPPDCDVLTYNRQGNKRGGGVAVFYRRAMTTEKIV